VLTSPVPLDADDENLRPATMHLAAKKTYDSVSSIELITALINVGLFSHTAAFLTAQGLR
jgi:hypothetical protein